MCPAMPPARADLSGAAGPVSRKRQVPASSSTRACDSSTNVAGPMAAIGWRRAGRKRSGPPLRCCSSAACSAARERACNRSASMLLHHRGQMPKNCENQELHDINLKLVGWPWAENNFSWTEPTVWACLALRRLGLGEHPRVQEGMAMLLDRAMDEGGINYGNRRILGRIDRTDPGPHRPDAAGPAGHRSSAPGRGRSVSGDSRWPATISSICAGPRSPWICIGICPERRKPWAGSTRRFSRRIRIGPRPAGSSPRRLRQALTALALATTPVADPPGTAGTSLELLQTAERERRPVGQAAAAPVGKKKPALGQRHRHLVSRPGRQGGGPAAAVADAIRGPHRPGREL